MSIEKVLALISLTMAALQFVALAMYSKAKKKNKNDQIVQRLIDYWDKTTFETSSEANGYWIAMKIAGAKQHTPEDNDETDLIKGENK